MDAKHKLNGLKVTYIGQASIDGIGGGGAARVKSMVNLFKNLGYKIELISYSSHFNKFGIKHKKIDQQLQTTTVCVPTNLPKFLKLLTIFPLFYYAWKSQKDSNLMFADFITLVTSLPMVILKKIYIKPVILDYIDIEPKIIPKSIYKYIAKNADIVFVISSYLQELAIGKYGCRNVVYLPIFIDTNLFKFSMNDRKQVREELRIENEEITIGYAGSFWYVEGIPILLHAFKNLTKKYSEVKLAIIGDVFLQNTDDDIARLVANMNLQNEVILIPSQPHEEVPKFLSAFDILCCPKIDCEINKAANPVKVPEYLSMGLPTVASAVGGIIDTIEDGVNGFLVKPGDVKELEVALEKVILNMEHSREIGEKGRKTAIEKYSYKAVEDTIKHTIRGSYLCEGQ